MHRHQQVRRRGAALLVAAASLFSLVSVQNAAADTAQPAAAQSGTVTTIEDRAARTIAASLTDTTWRSRVRDAALATEQVDLQALADRSGSLPVAAGLGPTLADANRRIAVAKGLDGRTGPLLRIRLGDDSMRAGLAGGAAPLVAAAPADDSARTVTAYDSRGRAHLLDVRSVPKRPVYVVDLDVSRAVAAGLDVLKEELARHGLSAPARTTAAAGGFWTSRITAVRLSDDLEPWVKGDAEIYSLVTGFGLDGKVRVDPVDMPYLNTDGITYYPNQILVNWSNYKYNLADAVMMEEDGSTNYRDLAKALATALLTITDQGMYIPLVNALLDAMPNEWWTDDPDYVDSWYTLARTDNATRNGASANGWMTLQPYYVEQF